MQATNERKQLSFRPMLRHSKVQGSNVAIVSFQ